MSDTVRLNVVLQLPPEIVEYALSLSKNLSKRSECYFVLGSSGPYPHITLYMGVYPERSVSAVLDVVRATAVESAPVACAAIGVDSLWGFVGIKLLLTAELRALHTRLLQCLNPLRKGNIFPKYLEPEYQCRFISARRESVQKYGYPCALECFSPHISLTRFKDETLAAEVSRNLKCELKPFTVNALAVYEMGEHGTCTKLVQKFPFGIGG